MPEMRPLTTHDQASGLRRLFGARDRGLRVYPCVTPAGGGDQLTFAIGLAGALARQGRRVLMLDGDDGRLAPLLGLKARYDLRHLLAGDRGAEVVALPTAAGFRVIPAARALLESARGQRPASDLKRWLAGLAQECDAIVACTTVESLGALMVDEAQEFLLVCGAEPWQLARTYARIKLLHDCYPSRRFRIAYCPAESVPLAERAHERLARATALYLGLAIEFGGAIRNEVGPGRGPDRPVPTLTGSPRSTAGHSSASRSSAASRSAFDPSSIHEALEQAYDQAAASLLIQGPPAPARVAATPAPDPADAAFFSVVESIADVYGPRHA